jgi:hypothetical protein
MYLYKEYLPIEFVWFIFSLFGMFVFSFIMLQFIRNGRRLCIVILTIILFYTNITNVPIEIFYLRYVAKYIIFFWLRCLVYIVYRSLPKMKYLYKRISYTVVVLAVLLLLAISNYHSEVVKFASSCIGISLCIALSDVLSSYSNNLLWLLGNYSYQVFLLSWFFQRFVETIGFQKLGLQFYVTFPCSFVCALIGPVIVSRYIDKRLVRIKVFVGL